MREILFRGKRVDNGEWAFGDFGFYPDRTKIDTHKNGQPWRGFDVIPETVGQFTGLTANGTRVFEGDVVHVCDHLVCDDHPLREFEGVVGFRDASFVITEDTYTHYRWLDYEVTVIGNVHDNPELIGERKDSESMDCER